MTAILLNQEGVHQTRDGSARDLVLTHPPGRVTSKGERDMATEVDYAVESAVRTLLAEQTPDITFLGEEDGTAAAIKGQPVWALDPVDGTANFIHEVPLCGVSLGLIRDGAPVLGVIDLPFFHSRYTAIQGEGAYANGQPIQVRTTSALSEAIIGLGDYAVGGDDEPNNSPQLAITRELAQRAQRVRMFGSAAVDLAWVASGRLDAIIMLSNKPWDTAAGVAIAREAGARVVDADGSEHTFRSRVTMATTPALYDALMDVVGAALSDTTSNI